MSAPVFQHNMYNKGLDLTQEGREACRTISPAALQLSNPEKIIVALTTLPAGQVKAGIREHSIGERE